MSQTDEDLEDLPIDEEEVEEEEEHWSLYNSQSFISVPFHSDKCTIQGDILQFHFSFGYNCRKVFNLTTPDPDTILFSSGNFINFLDVPSKAISFRRSALGGGIGHIKANPHPEFNHVAVAEDGNVPLIIIYEWPTLDIVCALKGGSSRIYSHLDFSPDGLLLVSQGGEPDYMITVWNWQKRRILLRTKSYVNDVYRVKFSPFVPGQLTTCGIAHIKFWKMAQTFTGLKLKGELGRFGKTEFSDILGVLPMPDEKVVSGCSWGNILVWDAGLIKLEVFRTLRRKCHEGPIVQLSFNEGELMTVAMDGHVKIWWYEKIDQADPPDDDRIIQIEPTYDFYTPGLMLMCIRKRYPDPKDSTYFGQDGNGGIWIIDLNTEQTPKQSVQLYKCHAGKVVDLATCPWGPFLASFGEDGRIYLYDYLKKELIFDYQYPAKGTCMMWITPKLSPSGDELIMGFDDGTLRVSLLTVSEEIDLKVLQITKPHAKPVTKITINRTNDVLVSGGEDCTIFLFQIKMETHVELVPIGYIKVPNPVTCFAWHFSKDDELIVGCLRGEILQLQVLKEPQPYTTVSYLLQIEPQTNKFTTYKAQIRRDIKIAEIQAKKAGKVAKKRVEMEKLKAENPGLDIDEEVFLADSETEEELEPLHIPEIPNRIIWMQSTPNNTIWLSMGGYDAGYIYEYQIDQKSEVPCFFRMVDNADDVEISSYTYNYNKKYLIFAMQNGEIRVNRLQDQNFRDLSDYWSVAMHDNQNGFVPNMCFSFDEKYFFTAGHDGNVFSYIFKPENDNYIPEDEIPVVTDRTTTPPTVEDEPSYKTLSIEQASLKKEQDRIDDLAARHREVYREKLRGLRTRFFKMLRRNSSLLPSQEIASERLEVDRRVTAYLNQKLEDELALVKRKLAFDVQKSELRMNKMKRYYLDDLIYNPLTVTGLRRDIAVIMLRENKIGDEFDNMMKLVEQKLYEDDMRGRPPERPPPPPKAIKVKKIKDTGGEYFLVNLTPSMIENSTNNKLIRLLQKYRDRKLKWEKRDEVWEDFLAKKPVEGVNHPDDDAELARAKQTIGDYKLKSDPSFRPTKEQRENTNKKYKELLLTRKKQHQIRLDLDNEIYELREEKQRIRARLAELQKKLKNIHQEIPEVMQKQGPSVKESLPSEFPERDFEINVTLKLEDDYYRPKHAPVPVVLEPADFDHHELNVLPKHTKQFDAKDPGDLACLDFETLCGFSKNEKKDTVWEDDLRTRRLQRKFFEQDEILRVMDKTIKDFDDRVEAVNTAKYQVDVNARVMDIFLVTLHQELAILREFEALENSLQEKVNQKNLELLDMRDVIDDIKNQILHAENDIVKGQETIRTMQGTFTNAVLENKFYDFLRKVYRKKYKPPKVARGDESSSESSSSSSDSSTESEDDGKSIDSRDFGIIKQDLNVCPKGCEQAVYDYTVNLRTERHQIEIKIRDILKNIDIYKKNLEIHNKKVVVIDKDLNKRQHELEAFQREKQAKLNEVRCTVVLKLHQIQHVTEDNRMSGVMETLVFSKTKLTELYKRVEELQDETQTEIKRHHRNVKHFTRMTTDCKFMSKQIKLLQEEITGAMKIKFGKVVDLNEIEEAMLRRTFGKDDLHDLEEVILKKIIHDLRLSMMDIKGMYMEQLRLWKDRIVETRKELTYALRYNTSQQELLSFLFKEKTELAQTLISQEKKKQHLVGVEDVLKKHTEEIAKIETIVDEQNQKIQELRDEIRLLRTKGMVLQPKELKHKEEVKEEEHEEPIKVWEHIKALEEEVVEEEETPRKPFSTEIIIPITLDEKSQDLAAEIVTELLQNLDVALTKRAKENLVSDILTSIMRGVSMADLLQDLLRNLPIKPTEDQMGVIESAAEQLYVVGEPDTLEEDKDFCAREIMGDILDEALVTAGDPQTVVARIVAKLLDQVPIDVLTDQTSLDYIDQRLSESDLRAQLRRQEIVRMVATKEAHRLLEGVLQDVFDTGVDLLYYIRDH